MILLAGFLEVLFHALVLIGLSAAVGGAVFVLWVLRPLSDPTPLGQVAIRRALILLTTGGVVLALSQSIVLLVEPWALADELGRWPLAEFLATGFARAGLVYVGLALCLTGTSGWLLKHPASRVGWMAMIVAAAVLMVGGAWLVHAVSRLEGAVPLMVVTVLHQLGTAVWVGGILHLAGLWRLTRRHPAEPQLWPRLLARFSPLAMLSVGSLVATGIYLWWRYIGDWEGLIGTAYGVMVLAKVALLAAALSLGTMNFFLVRRWSRRGDRHGVLVRVPAFVEAEMGIVVILLFAAAELSSQAPAVDVATERATPAEVGEVFAPKKPRLIPPPRQDLLAHASSSLDFSVPPSALDRIQSDFNHNVAGVFVLVIGLGAMLDRTGRARWARHWPLLFLALGIFLVLVGEPRGWPLGNVEGFWETLVVPTVLQHRLATLLVIGLGLLEWRVQVGGLGHTRWRFVFPVLCTAGGALLLTHSHTLFSIKSEFLIEVSHASLGVLAVLVGAGRWLELRLPPPANQLPGLLWTIGLVLIGVVLLFYRET